MEIKLQTLRLSRYDEETHLKLKDDLENGPSVSNYIHQVGSRLEGSKDNNRTIYQSAFVALDGELAIGYLYISSMKNDEVFLEYTVLKEHRGRGYAKRIVNETTEYLFENHNIRSIRLDIDPSNRKSISVAEACGFFADEDEYGLRNYQGRIQFVKDSYCYESKRRK